MLLLNSISYACILLAGDARSFYVNTKISMGLPVLTRLKVEQKASFLPSVILTPY